MGKNIQVQLPNNRVVTLYVSNNADARAQAAKRYSQMYGVQFDPKDLRRYAEKQRRADIEYRQQVEQINQQRPAWAKNIKNWAQLTPAVRANIERKYKTQQARPKPAVPAFARKIKNWNKLSPAIKARIARQAGYTDIGGDLYTVDRKGTLATAGAVKSLQALADKEYQKQLDAALASMQSKARTTKPTTPIKKTGFQKRVERVAKRQEGISKRMENLEKAFDLSLYFGTAKTKAGRYAQKFASEALTLPTKFTVGAIDFLELAAEKTTATIEGLVVSRENTLKELSRAAKETPMEVARSFDVRDPATAAQLIAILGTGVKIGKTRSLKRTTAKTDLPKSQLTLDKSFETFSDSLLKKKGTQTARTAKAKLSVLKKKISVLNKQVVKKSNKTNLDIAKRENNLNRSLTSKEKRAVIKSLSKLNKAETNAVISDIIRREKKIGRNLRNSEIKAILKLRYDGTVKGMRRPTKTRLNGKSYPERLKRNISRFLRDEGGGIPRRTQVLELDKAIKLKVGQRLRPRLRERLIEVKPARPKIRYIPGLAVTAAESSIFATAQIEKLKPIELQRPAVDIAAAQQVGQQVGVIQLQGQKQAQLQIPKSLLFSIAGAAVATTAIQRLRSRRQPPKIIKGKKASGQGFDVTFNKAVYSAKRNKKGIYLPDLYAVLTGEKVTGAKAAKLINPMTVFTGFEARPIVG